MTRFSTVVAIAALAFGGVTSASAAPITEVEFNSSIAGAQVIPASAFTLPAPGTVLPPGFPTATISGLGGGTDLDFYAFTASGGDVYFDIDNAPFTFDTILALFDSSGTLLAFDDDSSSTPEDSGTESGFDSLLGVFTLPGPGTYYVAVSQFANFPNGLNNSTLFTSLTRPDGIFGGVVVGDPTPGDSSYALQGGTGTMPYTLHVSVQNPGTQAVPEPVTLLLFGAALTATAVRMRRR